MTCHSAVPVLCQALHSRRRAEACNSAFWGTIQTSPSLSRIATEPRVSPLHAMACEGMPAGDFSTD